MKHLTERHVWRMGLLALVIGMSSLAHAEDVTVTTYYPSPRGNYQTLSTTGSTNLVTNPTNPTDRVIIGPADDATTRLVIRGRFQVNDGTPNPTGMVLSAVTPGSNGQGAVAGWTPLSAVGVVTGPGTPNFVPLWNTATDLDDSVIQQFGGNIGIGTIPGAFKLDVAGTGHLTGLTLSPGFISCDLGTNAAGGVICGPVDLDTIIGNEVTFVTAGAGLTGGGGPGAISLALANPIKSCQNPGEFMTSFNLGAAGFATCAPPPVGGPGGSTSRLLAGLNITINGVAGGTWDPDTDLDATIAATVGGPGLPSGATGETLRNTAAGVNWAASNVIYNNGTNVGIGMQTPGARLNVSDTFRVGTTAQAGLDFNVNSGDLYLGGANSQAGNLIIKNASGINTIQINADNPSIFGTDVLVQGERVCRANVVIPGCGGGGSVGPGTPNRVAKFNAAGTNVIDSLITDTGTNVGIGTTSPAGRLTVSDGTDNVDLYFSTGTPRLRLRDSGSTDWELDSSGGSFRIFQPGSVKLTINPASRVDITGDLFVANQRVCRADGTGCPPGGGGTGTLSQGANITLSPNPWDPDTGVNATISASGVGGGTVTAGNGLTGGGALPTTLDVNAGSGVTVVSDQVRLANPSKGCGANTAIQSFDLTNGNAPACIAVGAGGGTGTLSAGANITLSPNPWDPDTGANATISASGSGSVGPGSSNTMAKFNGAGNNVTNSQMSDDGTWVRMGGTMQFGPGGGDAYIGGGSQSGNVFIRDAGGTTRITLNSDGDSDFHDAVMIRHPAQNPYAMVPGGFGAQGDLFVGSRLFVGTSIVFGGNTGYITPHPNGNTIWVRDNLAVQGIMSATTKFFEIDHPTKPGYKLIHASLEGPENAVFYRGEAQLARGQATVELPDYFEALTRKEHRTVQLTPVGGWSALYVVEQQNGQTVMDGKFTARTTTDGNPSQRFHWVVQAVRADVQAVEVERPTMEGSE